MPGLWLQCSRMVAQENCPSLFLPDRNLDRQQVYSLEEVVGMAKSLKT